MELKKLNSLKIHDPPKNGATERSELFQRRNPNGLKTHEIMLTIPIHKRNTNQNHLRFHLTPVRIASIKNTTNNKCWQGCREKGTLIHCCWECKLVQPLWKTIWRLLKRISIDLPYDPSIPLLGISLKE
jgi:hypothetical protein